MTLKLAAAGAALAWALTALAATPLQSGTAAAIPPAIPTRCEPMLAPLAVAGGDALNDGCHHVRVGQRG